jgi:hypothetical protein
MRAVMKNSNPYRDKWGNLKYCNSEKTVSAARISRTLDHPPGPEISVLKIIGLKPDTGHLKMCAFLWVFKNRFVAHFPLSRKHKC